MVRPLLGQLAKHSAVYGVADVVPYLINFLLLPVFTEHLSTADYGALGILLLFGVTAKIFFRMGLDAGFFRLYYEQDTDDDRRCLATTLFVTVVSVSTALFFLCTLYSAQIGGWLVADYGDSGPRLNDLSRLSNVLGTWVSLVALDTLLNTLAFVPMNLFRIKGRPQSFTAITLIRSFTNIGLKLLLVVKGHGVSGVLWADVVASFLFILTLTPTLLRNLGWGFSFRQLRDAAAFGLPKVPHGLAHQVLNLSDRKLIEIFATISAAGLYHVGYMMGTGVKFFLSAFELAWSPFVYSQLKKPDAPVILARLATYAAGALFGFALLNAVFGRELLLLMAQPEYHEGQSVIPIVVLAYTLQGLFALTSIGIGISKKAIYYPILTFTAATMNVALNIWWIPELGIDGAAWATVAGYATMVVMGFTFGQKHYPIPFEWRRLSILMLTALGAYGISWLAPTAILPSLGFKTLAVLTFPLGVWLFGFLSRDEIDWLRSLRERS